MAKHSDVHGIFRGVPLGYPWNGYSHGVTLEAYHGGIPWYIPWGTTCHGVSNGASHGASHGVAIVSHGLPHDASWDSARGVNWYRMEDVVCPIYSHGATDRISTPMVAREAPHRVPRRTLRGVLRGVVCLTKHPIWYAMVSHGVPHGAPWSASNHTEKHTSLGVCSGLPDAIPTLPWCSSWIIP